MTVALAVPPLTVKNRHVRLIGHVRLIERIRHGLSQQGVCVSFWTPKPFKSTPPDTQFLCEEFLKMSISSILLDFFHLHVIPMTLYKNIMPYLDKFILVYD